MNYSEIPKRTDDTNTACAIVNKCLSNAVKQSDKSDSEFLLLNEQTQTETCTPKSISESNESEPLTVNVFPDVNAEIENDIDQMNNEIIIDEAICKNDETEITIEV